MEKTVTEFALMCGVSTTAIRKMIAKNKLDAYKDEYGNYILNLDDEKNQSYYNQKNQFQNMVTNFENQTSKHIEQDIEILKQPDNEVMLTLITELKSLSFEAGKAKQLEDNLIEKKADVKYWQDKYFELQNLNNQFQNQVRNLEKENIELKEKITQLESKKGLFGLFRN